jgi:hypothetical protein
VTVGDALIGLVRRHRESSGDRKGVDLRATLDGFLKQVAKQHRKAKTGFEFKIKPETVEAGGERTAHHFSWTAGGQGQGQGKIWRCSHCGRTVIVQVVGQTRDNLAPVASQLFGSFRCHGCDGWEVWALYDLVAAVPDDFRLKGQILMSGRLRLEFERGRGERLQIERWGLANVTRKRFTLAEWLREAVGAGRNRVAPAETTVQDHPAASVSGRIAGALPWVRALRDAGLPPRPASRYAACCWECAETNKIYAIQLWHSARTVGLLEEVAQRCECH